MWMVIIACSVPACWPLVTHLLRRFRSRGGSKHKSSGHLDRRSTCLRDMGGSYHARTSRAASLVDASLRTDSHEKILPEDGILARKDISVQRDYESAPGAPSARRNSSFEDHATEVVSATEQV